MLSSLKVPLFVLLYLSMLLCYFGICLPIERRLKSRAKVGYTFTEIKYFWTSDFAITSGSFLKIRLLNGALLVSPDHSALCKQFDGIFDENMLLQLAEIAISQGYKVNWHNSHEFLLLPKDKTA